MRKAALLVMLAGLPMGFFAVRAVVVTAGRLADPCLEWREPGEPPAAGVSLRAGVGPCSTRMGGTSQTRRGAVIETLLVPGGILAAIALGIAGTLLLRPAVTVWGGLLMIAEAAPTIFSIAPLAALTGAVFVASGVRQRRTLPASPR